MWDVALDALLDTLKLLPFLFVLYILIELMEHNTRVGRPRRALSGKWAPALGACTGLVPMCGFSVMAAKLYEHRHITIGTLIAVFIATSDEGLLVLLLSEHIAWGPKLYSLLAMCGCKLVLGIAAGYLLDLLVRKKPSPLPEHTHNGEAHIHEKSVHHVREGAQSDIGSHDHVCDEESEDHADHAHGACACDELSPCEHKKESKVEMYLVSPLLHALEVAAFVLLANLAFGYLFYGLGEENVTAFMQGAGYWIQPIVCSLIGAVPNCASSVVLAEAYALGGIGFGGLLAGLSVNAGLGYLVLMKKNSWKQGLLILTGMFIFGVAVGYAANAVGLAF